MSVQAEQSTVRTPTRSSIPLADIVALVCALVMLLGFFATAWFYWVAEDSQTVSFTGSEVAGWNDSLEQVMAQYTTRVESSIEITRGDIASPLLLIPLAGIAAVVLSLVGLFRPRYRRITAALTLLAGLAALLYYAQFFLLDRRLFLAYFDLTRRMTDNIPLTILGGGGFWLAFFAAIGLVVQYRIARPGSTAVSVPGVSRLLAPFRQLRDRYQAGLGRNPRYLRVISAIFRFQSFFGLIIIIVLAVLLSPVRNDQLIFLGQRNLSNVARDVSETGIMAVGQLLVILVGGIDLSVGSMVALGATGSAFLLMRDHVPAIPAILIILAMGALIGWWNGWVSERFKVPAFVSTLAMSLIARGLAHVWSTDIAVPLSYQAGGADPFFELIGQRINGVFPVPAIIMLVVALIMGLILHFTGFGRHIYATGGNETAARLSGVVVKRIKILAFTLCSFFAAMAGIVHASQLNQGSPNEAINYELNAIAAVVIGGASLMGGKGTIVGAIAGAFILGILDNMLSLNNVNSNVQLIAKGFIVIGAVALQQFRPREAE